MRTPTTVPLARIRSLDLLRGFVAAARRMSVTLAAEDLCVTQSAVSKQVRALEETLGVKLFVRGNRRLALTPAGEDLFRAADAALRQLQDAFDGRVPGAREPVTLTATIGFAALWLLPRLRSFQQRHPDIELRVAATSSVLPLDLGGADLAIRYCTEANAPAGSVRIFGETIAPVASPSAASGDTLASRNIGAQVLLEFDDPQFRYRWADWLAPRGLHIAKARAVLSFNQYDMAIRAAAAGQGIALGRLELLDGLLRSGGLAVLAEPDEWARSPFAFWLARAAGPQRPQVEAVARWLQAEADAVPQFARGSESRTITEIA